MKTTFKLFTLLLTLTLLVLPTSAVHAGGFSTGMFDGRVIFGDNFTLKSGDTLNGDLVVFGGNVTVEEDATVNGDVVVFGGNVNLDGTVNDSVVIIGGTMHMGEMSVVKGDLVTVGGSLTREPGAEVGGDVVTDVPAPNIQIPDVQVPNAPTPPIPPYGYDFNFNPLGRFLQMMGTAIAVSLLAMLASLFLQPQIERVSQAAFGQPVIAGSVGLLTGVLAPFVLVILAVTIILIPVALLAVIALALAWLFGLISLGTEVGERFTKAISQTWAPPLTAGLGTFLLMVVVGSIGMIPCVGWLVTSLVALFGIGGVVLTLFGSQPYPRVVVPAPLPGNDPVG